MTELVIAHLYPSELNLYGDSGNVTALRKRLEWRGYDVQVVTVGVGARFDLEGADIVVGGGGQDGGLQRVSKDLLRHGPALRTAVADGLPLLAVGGLYQLLGEGLTTFAGREMPGIGLFAAVTIGSSRRMIGHVVVESPLGKIVGFENHSGDTILGPGQSPLGEVVRGHGNNARRQWEGAMLGHAVGTYLHGPVLPQNPALTDHLISAALRRRLPAAGLTALGDELELAAHRTVLRRPSAPTPRSRSIRKLSRSPPAAAG